MPRIVSYYTTCSSRRGCSISAPVEQIAAAVAPALPRVFAANSF